jgi:hypothetical protein
LEWTQRLPEYNEADRPILRKLRCGFAMRKQQYKLNGVEFELTEIVHGGVTMGWRYAMECVWIVQMIAACTILVCGSAYIWNAHDVEDLMENAISLTFVIEVDDLLYKYMLTPQAERWFQNSIPPIPVIKNYNDTRSEEELRDQLGRHYTGGATGQRDHLGPIFSAVAAGLCEIVFGAGGGWLRLCSGMVWIAASWVWACHVAPSFAGAAPLPTGYENISSTS